MCNSNQSSDATQLADPLSHEIQKKTIGSFSVSQYTNLQRRCTAYSVTMTQRRHQITGSRAVLMEGSEANVIIPGRRLSVRPATGLHEREDIPVADAKSRFTLMVPCTPL